MTKKTALLSLTVFAAVTLAGPARAQIPFDHNRNQAVGVTVGLASGTGLSYQEILPSALGFRAAILAWKKGDSSFIDLGVSGLRVLSDDGRKRVYLVGSMGWWRRSDEDTEVEFDDEGNVVSERVFDDVDDSGALGLGAGIELPVGPAVAVSLEGVFTYWTDSGDLIPAPQLSLHWQF
jgi:hypothetical protein